MSAIIQVVIVSDLHCGCQLGLCPPVPIELDNGGTYTASTLQQKVWSWWEEFWSKWVPMVTRGEPFAVVINGDTLDGNHHNSTHQISHNLADQRRISEIILKPVCRQCNGNLYMIRGTEAHVGKSGQEEETLAKEIGAIPNEIGNYARWDLWLRIGGKLAHITHHIGTTSSLQYETTALMKEYAIACAEAGCWGLENPSWVVRAHRHRFSKIEVPTSRGDGICVVTPGWQLKTPFVWHGAGRNTNPQFGGILLRTGNEEHFTRQKIWNIGRTQEVVL